MNKTFGALVIGLLLIPSAAFAQTVNSDNTAQIQATLASLIAQVKVLQARLEALESSVVSLEASTSTMTEATTSLVLIPKTDENSEYQPLRNRPGCFVSRFNRDDIACGD